MGKIKALKEKRAVIQQESEALVASVPETRSFTAEESDKFKDIEKRFKEVDAEIALLEQNEARSMKLALDAVPGKKQEDNDKEQRSAFIAYMRGKETAEQRSLITGTDGSVFIPTTISSIIEKKLRDSGDFLSAISILMTGQGNKIIIPVVNGSDERAKSVAEYAESTEEEQIFGKIELGAHTYRTPIALLSYELLQDSSVDIEAIIIDTLVDSLRAGLNYDATLGDGVDKAKGIMMDAAVGATAQSESAISYDDLVDLRKSVKRAYSKKGDASFMMNANTQAELMKIKDTTGRPIFVESVKEGAPDQLLGFPVVINEDMEDIGPGTKSVAFGSLKKYMLRISRGVSIEKFAEAYKKYLSVGVMAFMRIDSKLLNAGTNPVKLLQHPGVKPTEAAAE